MSAETPIEVSKEELEEIARALERISQRVEREAHTREELLELAKRLAGLAGEAAEKKAKAQESTLREAYLEWRTAHLEACAKGRAGQFMAVAWDAQRGFEAAGYGEDPAAALAAAATTYPDREILPIFEKL